MSLVPQAYDVEWTALDRGVFNDGPGGGDGSSPPPPTSVPVVATPSPQGPIAWSNPCSGYGIPFGQFATLLLQKNPKRVLLILQNLSTQTVAGDIAPVLYFQFGRPAIVGQSQALFAGTNGAPGGAIVLDYSVPRDTLYVLFAPVTANAGNSVVVAGAVTEGAHSPEGLDYVLSAQPGRQQLPAGAGFG